MGNEASKQQEAAVEPPPEWDPTSNAKQFELVSPMSDLSDPSMFLHRRPHPQLSDATVQQIVRNSKPKQQQQLRPAGKENCAGQDAHRGRTVKARQTSAGDRRRKSKVIATRDNAYKHESRTREMPPPSAFYFPEVPTKESEDKVNRLTARRSTSTGARRLSKESQDKSAGKNSKKGNQQNARRNKTTPLIVKARRKVYRARTCLTGCFEESGHKLQLMKDNTKIESKRGELLPSEAGVESSAELGKESDKPKQSSKPSLSSTFDPYKQDPLPRIAQKPTILQFVDGSEKELSFNPVWRESHDGTYHGGSTTTASRRESGKSSLSKAGRASNVGSDSSKTSLRKDDRVAVKSSSSSTELSRQPVDPPSIQEDASASDKGADDPNEKNPEPYRPSNAGSDMGSNTMNNRKSTGPNADEHKRESMGSAATSHESSYWNGFYNETQMLHREDAYFDRIAFDPRASMPETSPMTNNTTATPVMALFKQDEKPKSLLGITASMDDPQEDEMQNFFDTAIVTRQSVSPSQEQGAVSKAGDARDAEEPTLETDTGHPTEAQEDASASASTVSKHLNENDVTANDQKDLDLGTKDTEEEERQDEVVTSGNAPDDENNEPGTRGVQNLFENWSMKSDDAASEEKLKTTGQLGATSFLDRRISADTVLVQSALVSKATSAPKRHTIEIITKGALQETPQSLIRKDRTSFGSAFSYKDKDVFTPVTSLATYPKGSPFRPRVSNVGNGGMVTAKAKLGQTTMFTQSFDNISRSSRDLEIHATGSAPSMVETHDYRDIAFGCFLEDTPSTVANKNEWEKQRERARLSNMSAESPMSATMSPAQLMLSNQAITNAAFLFSPSYANGPAITGQPDDDKSSGAASGRELSTQEGAKSISCLESRQRTRSLMKQPVRIPGSRSGRSVASSKNSGRPPRKSSMSESSHQKSVRFSDAQSVAASETGSQKSRRSVTWDFSFNPPPQNVPTDIPAIETKVSDLSDTVFGRESFDTSSNEKVRESSLSNKQSNLRKMSIQEEITPVPSFETTSTKPSLASTSESLEYSSESRPSISTTSKDSSAGASIGTPEQNLRTWTYCEFSKGVTPVLDKKQLAQATNSPVLRFKAAKNRFVNKQEKDVPVKRKSPRAYKRTGGTAGRVHLLASKFDGGPALDPTSAIPSISRTGSGASNDRPMLRTPQIVGYTTTHLTHSSSYSRASLDSYSSYNYSKPNVVPPLAHDPIPEDPVDEMPSDEESDDESYVQSVATVRQEGRDAMPAISVTLSEDTEDSRGSQGTERTEDLLTNLLGKASVDDEDEETVATVPQQSNAYSVQQLRSVVSHDDEENSTFTNIMSAPTFSDESTTLSTILAQQPQSNLRHHGVRTVKPESLYLSPLQRTTMEQSKWREEPLRPLPAQKWRALADKANKENNMKKGGRIFRNI